MVNPPEIESPGWITPDNRVFQEDAFDQTHSCLVGKHLPGAMEQVDAEFDVAFTMVNRNKRRVGEVMRRVFPGFRAAFVEDRQGSYLWRRRR